MGLPPPRRRRSSPTRRARAKLDEQARVDNEPDARAWPTGAPSDPRRRGARERAVRGRTVGEIADEEGRDPWDVLTTSRVADELITSFGTDAPTSTDDDWKPRIEVWRDCRAVIGASDAGAHLDLLASFNYATVLLGEAVREHGLLPLEEAVHLITDMPAQLYGLATGAGSRSAPRRRRRASTPPPSAATPCACAWTSPAAPAGSTPSSTASSTCS